jgi:O-6-methylguanine DNA methyltransferase
MLLTASAKGKEQVVLSGFGTFSELKRRLPSAYALCHVHAVKDVHPYGAYVEAYFKGDRKALTKIPYTQTGADFSMRVWHALTEIPYGETISYKALAEKAGNVKAVRAAGTACGTNHLILLVPCHRVVKSGGGLGEYLYGEKRKRFLLEHEQGRRSVRA